MAFSKTFSGLPATNTSSCETKVKVVAFECKAQRSYWRGCGRVVDSDNTGLWFEVTGDSKSDCSKRGGILPVSKTVILSNMAIKRSSWHSQSGCSAGNLIDANPARKLKVSPIAAAHVDAMKLTACFPVPRGRIAQLLKSSGNERVDVRGLVASVQEPTNKANKMEIWLEDETEKAVLVEMWGGTPSWLLPKSLNLGRCCRLKTHN